MNSPRFSALSRRSSRRGFTLMEMIIVLTIIALLVALAMGQLGGIGDVAKRQAAIANISTLKAALFAYQLDNGSFPTTNQGMKALWARPTMEPIPAHWHALASGDISMDPWGHPYQYICPGKHNPSSFDIWSMGDDGASNTDDDLGNWKDSAH